MVILCFILYNTFLQCRIRNEEIRGRVRVQSDLSRMVKKYVLRWFGHIERMFGEWIAMRVYELGVEGRRCRGRPT